MSELQIYLYISFFLSFYLQHYFISLKQNDKLTISEDRKNWILQLVEGWQKMHDLRMKLNQTSPRQKQHSTRRIFDQKLGIKFKEETNRGLHLDSVRQIGQFRK